MKKILLLALLSLPLTAISQTYMNYTLMDFTNSVVGTFGQNQTIIDLSTNVAMKIISLRATDYAYVYAQFPQSTNQVIVSGSGYSTDFPQTVLGPAKVFFYGYGQNSVQDICVLTAEFQAVNTVPDLSGLAVQPAGKTASVQIEASPDLKSWQPITGGSYPATNAAAFYRLKLDLN